MVNKLDRQRRRPFYEILQMEEVFLYPGRITSLFYLQFVSVECSLSVIQQRDSWMPGVVTVFIKKYGGFVMKVQARASLFAFLLTCCFIAGCSAEDKPAVPAATKENMAPVKNIFQPSTIDPTLVRQSMQARSEYEEMNRKIITRMNKLYEENPEIKDLQAKMRELQKKIDALLAEDEELAKLKKKSQSIAPEIPAIPRKFAPPVSTNGNK